MLTGIILTAFVFHQSAVSSPGDQREPIGKPRSITAMALEITALLNRESVAEAEADRVAVVHRLMEIHREIVSDQRFPTSELLQQQRHKVHTRLTSLRDEIKRKLAQQKKMPSHKQQLLQTQLNEHYALAGQMLNGPAAIFAGGGSVPNDFSQELIDLIQTTIHPASWDVNGGRGSIRYYSPVFALVVRANSEVHAEIADELGALR
jgi:hypothetical protein